MPKEAAPPGPEAASWKQARELAARCERCDLYRNATWTVFGEGPVPAPLMLVGEQPGDQEDQQGRPFVGPAGRMLLQALTQAGIDRDDAYVTNAVKHFKNVPRGKRRIHQKPNQGEIDHCRWWLGLELDFVTPRVVVALGATAARSVTGKAVTISRQRGSPLPLPEGGECLVTVHPAFILRQRDEGGRKREFAGLVDDLKLAGQRLRETE